MFSQTKGINATKGEGYRKSGKSFLHNRKIYPRQETHQGLDRRMKQHTLTYDSGLSERLERISREIEELKRKLRIYNNPISTDNAL